MSGSDTLEELNERVVKLARALKLTRGRKLRTDGTVVEANIQHPTGSGLLADGVRVLGRLAHRAKALLDENTRAEAGNEGFHDRSRSDNRLTKKIDWLSRFAAMPPETFTEKLTANS